MNSIARIIVLIASGYYSLNIGYKLFFGYHNEIGKGDFWFGVLCGIVFLLSLASLFNKTRANGNNIKPKAVKTEATEKINGQKTESDTEKSGFESRFSDSRESWHFSSKHSDIEINFEKKTAKLNRPVITEIDSPFAVDFYYENPNSLGLIFKPCKRPDQAFIQEINSKSNLDACMSRLQLKSHAVPVLSNDASQKDKNLITAELTHIIKKVMNEIYFPEINSYKNEINQQIENEKEKIFKKMEPTETK